MDDVEWMSRARPTAGTLILTIALHRTRVACSKAVAQLLSYSKCDGGTDADMEKCLPASRQVTPNFGRWANETLE